MWFYDTPVRVDACPGTAGCVGLRRAIRAGHHAWADVGTGRAKGAARAEGAWFQSLRRNHDAAQRPMSWGRCGVSAAEMRRLEGVVSAPVGATPIARCRQPTLASARRRLLLGSRSHFGPPIKA